MKSILKRLALLCLLGAIALTPVAAFAHGMLLSLEEPGVLRVEYDGGGFSPETEISIYNEEGEELDRGFVDEEGEFHFESDLEVYRAVANDGMGHRAEYGEGARHRNIPKLPAVIGVFALVGIIYLVVKKRKR